MVRIGLLSPRFLTLAICGLIGATLSACGPSNPTVAGVTAFPLASWTGAEKEALDDGIDLTAISSDVSAGIEDGGDAGVERRLAACEGVLMVKVITVNSEPVGDRNRYRLEFVVEGEPLDGVSPGSPFFITIDGASPAFGLVRAQEAKLIGKKFGLFYRRYASTETDTLVIHFHMVGTTKRVIDAINRAKTRRSFR